MATRGKIGRASTIHRSGCTWKREENDNNWKTKLLDRFEVQTWPFGSIHQCKVFIDYPSARSDDGQSVGISLKPCKTRDEAMQQGIKWVKAYNPNRLLTAEKMFTQAFKKFPTVYRTHNDVLKNLFLGAGNGYVWLDGAVVYYNCGGYTVQRKPASRLKKNLGKPNEFPYDALGESEKKSRIGPLPDDGKPVPIWSVDEEYANVCLVPDDVRPEWLALAYEAAKLLRDRSSVAEKGTEAHVRHNHAVGRRVCKELLKRFPQLQKKGS
ncbi:hypothetical protein HY625_02600 [Candidatus Uhrbacteria bacterium]|nr:hypothetical protein [Candidatus Uhrbacteria bacterium]